MLVVLLEIVYSLTLSWMGKGEIFLPFIFSQLSENHFFKSLRAQYIDLGFFHDGDIVSLCSLLKIWNLNKFSGVVGAFNCQGAGKWPCKDKTHDENTSTSNPLALSGQVSPMDVEFLEELAGENWTGDCAVFAFNSGIVHPVILLGCQYTFK